MTNTATIKRSTPSCTYTFDAVTKEVTQAWVNEDRIISYKPGSSRYAEHVARIVTTPTSGYDGHIVHDTPESTTVLDIARGTVTRINNNNSFRAVYTRGHKNFRRMAGLTARLGSWWN